MAAFRELVFAAERTWMDVRCPVLSERITALDWRPDPPAAYCPRCGQSARPHDVSEGRCSTCREVKLPWSRLVRLGPYRPPLTRFVHEVKFTRWRRLGCDLGSVLAEAVVAAIEEEQTHRALPSRVVVVPVPMSFRRRAYRGIDHTRVLAKVVAERMGAEVAPRLLVRRHRPSQLAVQPSERTANVAKSISARRGWRWVPEWLRRESPDLRDTLVIVIDDVTTTGATLRATCRALRGVRRRAEGGGVGEVWVAVVAVTELESDAKP